MREPNYPYSMKYAIAESRADFIKLTYVHLCLAIISFIVVEVVLFQTGAARVIAEIAFQVNWLFFLGAFMLVGWIASRIAHTAESLPTQYIGLALYVVAQAVIFVPLLMIAELYAPDTIGRAGKITILATAGLTLIGFYTRKDFSFLRAILMWTGFSALILIVASALFGWELGTWFSVGMVVFAGAAILYDTSNIIHHFPEDRYVGAALELFASVALLFWYILRLLIAMDRD